MRSFRGERGSISAEYAGVVALAAAVVFALASMPLGERIADEIELLLCKIAHGGECPAASAVDSECLISSGTRESSFSVTVAVVTVGGGATLIKEVFADGRIRYTLVDDAEIAAELIAGAKARVGRLGFNATASLSAGGRLKDARVFEFTDPDDAADFEDEVRNEGTVQGLFHQAAEGDGLIGGIIGGPFSSFDPLGVKDWVADHVFGDDADDLPDATATFIDVETFLHGDAEAAGGIPGLDGELIGTAELAGGVKVTTSGPDAGQIELHYALSAEAAGDLGILALGPGIGGDASVTATLTIDEDFTPTKFAITGTAGYDGSPLDATELMHEGDLAALSSALERVSAGGRSGSGRQVEFSAELDLADERNRLAALGVLTGTPQAAIELARRIDQDGRLTFQLYDTTATDGGVEVAVGAGVGGGGGVTTSGGTQDLASAFVREPGGAWEARRCGPVGDRA